MTTPPDRDLILESLSEEMRSQLSALNELHHPVNPVAGSRIKELEYRIDDLRKSIAARRKELATSAAR
jgi:hypothetical protein